MKSDGIIVILSYPDTVVRPAYWEYSSKIWPKIGIGHKDAVRAGHAALLLIQKNNPTIQYYDFGRYITTYGNGRVRSEETDPELHIPIKAEFNNNQLSNLEELLLWLDQHPEKTHGNGRLIASINDQIDFSKAKNYIDGLIQQKEIPYGAFIKNGTNCARFVTDTIINSTTKNSMKLKLKSSFLLTPSPIGNTIKGKTSSTIYQVLNQQISIYKNRSILKEYKLFFAKKLNTEVNLIGTEQPDKKLFSLLNGTWLGGIGSGAWFSLSPTKIEGRYIISRFTDRGYKDFEGFFKSSTPGFNPEEPHEFVYPTNCSVAYIIQDTNIYVYRKVNSKPS